MTRVFMAMMLAAWSLPALTDATLQVEDAWVREAPPTARMMAAYMTLKNPGSSEAVVVRVESPAFSHIMLHKSEVVDGVARMMHQDELKIPAGGSVELEPGGFHLMMPAPEKRLNAGQRVEFILTLADGNSIRVQAEIRKKP